jgi:hypothetical protein
LHWTGTGRRCVTTQQRPCVPPRTPHEPTAVYNVSLRGKPIQDQRGSTPPAQQSRNRSAPARGREPIRRGSTSRKGENHEGQLDECDQRRLEHGR